MKKIYELPKLTVNIFTAESILHSSTDIIVDAFYGEEDIFTVTVK